tara:strand:- start:316 stop:1185 length:870 start_codon:yes stop_codon:yes gene_type:complete
MKFTLNTVYANQKFLPVLSFEEEKQVGEKLKNGNEREKQEAIEELVNRNLRLVIKIASNYQRCGLELDDLVSEGNSGLLEAARRFDPSQGKFSTYAAFWIRQKITRALCNHGRLVRIPVQLVQLQLKVLKFLEEYGKLKNSEPTETEIAEKLDEPIDLVKKVMSLRFRFDSMDQSVGDKDNEGTRADGGRRSSSASTTTRSEIFQLCDEKVSPLNQLITSDNKKVINKVLNNLKSREKYIIEHRFGLNDKDVKTLEKIGEDFGVTRERIRQLEFAAMKKLRFQLGKVFA